MRKWNCLWSSRTKSKNAARRRRGARTRCTSFCDWTRGRSESNLPVSNTAQQQLAQITMNFVLYRVRLMLERYRRYDRFWVTASLHRCSSTRSPVGRWMLLVPCRLRHGLLIHPLSSTSQSQRSRMIRSTSLFIADFSEIELLLIHLL